MLISMENQGRRALTYGCCMDSTEKKREGKKETIENSQERKNQGKTA